MPRVLQPRTGLGLGNKDGCDTPEIGEGTRSHQRQRTAKLDGVPQPVCARARQGRKERLLGRVSLGVDQGQVMECVHLILDECSVRYSSPTLRRLGKRGIISLAAL